MPDDLTSAPRSSGGEGMRAALLADAAAALARLAPGLPPAAGDLLRGLGAGIGLEELAAMAPEALAAEADLLMAEARLVGARRAHADTARRVRSARDPLFAGSRAAALTAEAADVVLLEPRSRDLRLLLDGSTPAGVGAGAAVPACALPEAARSGEISPGTVFGAAGDAVACYPSGGGHGLLVRDTCTDDGRGCFAVLTDKGAALLESARPTHLEGVRQRFLTHFSQDELQRFASAWERVLPGAAAVD